MDRTDAVGPSSEEAASSPRGSQSRLSGALFFVLLAALLFRVVTAVMDRSGAGTPTADRHAPPLVRWTALEKASPTSAAGRKPVLYDFTAEWCAPCHKLDQEGWADAEIAGLVNRSYVAARVLDRSREEGKNPALVEELQRKYSVEAFPTLVVAGTDGREIARMEGYGGRTVLENFLKESRAKSSAAPSPR